MSLINNPLPKLKTFGDVQKGDTLYCYTVYKGDFRPICETTRVSGISESSNEIDIFPKVIIPQLVLVVRLGNFSESIMVAKNSSSFLRYDSMSALKISTYELSECELMDFVNNFKYLHNESSFN